MLIDDWLNGHSPLLAMAPDSDAGGETPINAGNEPAPESQETPGETSGPDESGTPAETPDNWEQRYNDLRPEFDRKSQQLAEAERFQQAVSGQLGPEAQSQALDALGIELEGDEDNDTYTDPESRLDQVERTLQQQQMEAQQQAQQEALENYVGDEIEMIEKREGREFTDAEIRTMFALSVQNLKPDGLPDIETAFQQVKEIHDGAKATYLQSKKSSRTPGQGATATEAVDLSDPEARVNRFAQLIEADEATGE